MDSHHYSEFTLNLLILVTRMAAEGDYQAMEELGLRYDQVDKLQALSTQQMQEMALISKANFVSIQFDAEALDIAIKLGLQRVEHRNLIVALLRAGATKPIMQQLFGLTYLETAGLRRFMALPKADGRPPIPTEQQENDLWRAWQNIRQRPAELASQLLQLHELTGIKVNVIWPLILSWHQSRASA